MTNTPDKSELLSCPFCGGDTSVSDGSNGLHFRVICNKSACRAAGPLERCAVDAKDAWNTRTPSRPADQVPDMVEDSDDYYGPMFEPICREIERTCPEVTAGVRGFLARRITMLIERAALQAVPASGGLTKREEHFARLEIRNALGPSSGSIFPEPPALKASGEE